MRTIPILVILAASMMLVGCGAGGVGGGGGGGSTTYIGGTGSLAVDFMSGSPPEELFDQSQFPFSVNVIVPYFCLYLKYKQYLAYNYLHTAHHIFS